MYTYLFGMCANANTIESERRFGDGINVGSDASVTVMACACGAETRNLILFAINKEKLVKTLQKQYNKHVEVWAYLSTRVHTQTCSLVQTFFVNKLQTFRNKNFYILHSHEMLPHSIFTLLGASSTLHV